MKTIHASILALVPLLLAGVARAEPHCDPGGGIEPTFAGPPLLALFSREFVPSVPNPDGNNCNAPKVRAANPHGPYPNQHPREHALMWLVPPANTLSKRKISLRMAAGATLGTAPLQIEVYRQFMQLPGTGEWDLELRVLLVRTEPAQETFSATDEPVSTTEVWVIAQHEGIGVGFLHATLDTRPIAPCTAGGASFGSCVTILPGSESTTVTLNAGDHNSSFKIPTVPTTMVLLGNIETTAGSPSDEFYVAHVLGDE